MKHLRFIGFWWLILLTALLNAQPIDLGTLSAGKQRRLTDSIMDRVTLCAPSFEKVIGEYEADLYIKGHVKVPRKNQLIRFLPTMFRLEKKVNEYVMESHNEMQYTAPDIYVQKVKTVSGTAPELWEMDGRLPDYFQINIYSPSLFDDKFLSPISQSFRKYYRYRLDSILGDADHRQYKIRFMPKNRSYQLVGGYFIVSDEVWSIREFCFFGRSEMVRFHNRIRMGEIGEADEFLPVSYYMEGTFDYLGNRIEGSYTVEVDYKRISQEISLMQQKMLNLKKRSKYDLTASYALNNDTNLVQRNNRYFDTLRPIPLTEVEKRLYIDYQIRKDSIQENKKKKKTPMAFWGNLGDVLTSRYTVNLDNLGSFRGSPLINPFLLSYSGTRGISYRQDFRYTRLFSRDRLLKLTPRLGYNFTKREFYWRIRTDFFYFPKKNASLHLDIGNGNRIYSSDVLDELKAIPDSIFDFKQIHLDFFNDLYLKVDHRWEMINGLTLDVGVSMHRRSEIEKSKFVPIHPVIPGQGLQPKDPVIPPNILNKLRSTYISFAPHFRLTWTPGQYYYMSGHRKENLHSKNPTLSLDYERGVKGVFHSTGAYEKLEIDLQHAIKLGALEHLYYRLGWGTFTNQEEIFFVDFENLRRSNLPVGWNDEIGGVFQLLDSRWYNSSRKYVRAHATYESPFIVLPHGRLTQHVLDERLYLNVLCVPHLKPYMELGYGIGTHIFDFGFFVSSSNWKFEEVGCKFTFELFNR